MQPASSEGGGSDASRMLRRYGPIGLIAVVAIVVVIVIVAASGGDDDGDESVSEDTEPAATEPVATDAASEETEPADTEPADTDSPDAETEGTDTSEPDTTEPATTEATEDVPADTGLPEGVMNFSTADELGIIEDIDWGERCDTERGRVAVPDFFAPECFEPFEGDNGGATHQGVTEDTITIAYWQAQEQDPILAYLTSAILNDDTNAQNVETIENMLPYFETYYETYGRSVELVVVDASGTIADEAAARADAVRIAEDIQPFMVWGGPTLTSAFAEELAARDIPCISCGPSQQYQFYADNPFMNFSITTSTEQNGLIVAEYVGKRLAGQPAIHAGDEAMRNQDRVFGRIWIESSATSVELNEQFEAALGEYGVEIAESQSYVLDPATLQESAASVITRMKEAGVTSILISGDPIAPREFTNEASAQNYFPEWIMTGSTLMDTTAFARTYNQEQWQNAFGVSTLAARVARGVGSYFSLYEWFNGAEPPADDSIGVLIPTPATFYAYLQYTGPNLTPETFGQAVFDGPPTQTALTAPTLDYGENGRWPADLEPDYFGIDDISEIWWDPDEPGLDEIDKEGVGMWRWVDGGQRYLYGEIPEGPPDMFVEEGSVAIYEQRPPEETSPSDYTPLSPS
jgi:hypothetical protein